MPILLNCDCGATLQAKDEHAGKKTRCPKCGKILEISAAAPPVAPLAVSPPEEEHVPDALPAEDERHVRGSDTFGFADEPPPRPKVREPLERPPLKKRSGSAASQGGGGFFGPEMSGMRYGVLGGLAMMAIAVIWFVVGLFFDYIFFYPPILFIIGIVAVVRGLMSGNLAGRND